MGATVLSAGTLDNLQEIYDYKNKKFNEEAFFTKRAAWASTPKYSDIFKAVVLNLVRVNP